MFLVGMVAYERDGRAVATKDRRGRGLKTAVRKVEAIVAAFWRSGASRLEGGAVEAGIGAPGGFNV